MKPTKAQKKVYTAIEMSGVIISFRGKECNMTDVIACTPTNNALATFRKIITEGKLLIVHSKYPLDCKLLTEQHFVDDTALIMDANTFKYYSVTLSYEHVNFVQLMVNRYQIMNATISPTT